MSLRADLVDLIERTPIADTHEHIIEEVIRLAPGDRWCLPDIGVFFSHYTDSDLLAAGMREEDLNRALTLDAPVDEKWRLIRPWWEHIRHTGYGLCLRESLLALFGELDLTDDNWRSVNEKLQRLMKPGYYHDVLHIAANIDHCQVNSLESPIFCETAHPDLLLQDLSFLQLALGSEIPSFVQHTGIDVHTLADWHAVIDWCFAAYGPRAVAAKNQAAYLRRLDYADIAAEEVAPIFARHVKDPHSVSADERKAMEDHLFHYCVRKATEYNLPVKLHTGYYAGAGHMPLHRLRHNGGDMCDLCRLHPNTRFIFMHITYPYQDEAIAVAKHYRNAYIDMCWAWIINPVASVRFLKEYLLAAPANKLFVFGGDFAIVEMVPGHARIARKGIAQAINELLDEGWLREREAGALIQRLMLDNAREVFDLERCKQVTLR